MDTLFFHPKIVHLPIALALLMPLVAGSVLLAWWRKWLPARSWLIVVALQAILIVSGMVSLQTGEAEEERVERAVPEQAIEAHEEAAEVFVWASGVVLGLMLLGLATARRREGLPLSAIGTLGTLVVLGLGYQTGQAGGELVYRHGAASVYVSRGGDPAPGLGAPRRDHDDDD
jgi:uncharacterized membrane protein